MRWNKYEVKPPSPWKRWFAWYPVEIDAFSGDMVWWEWVERRQRGHSRYHQYRYVETV